MPQRLLIVEGPGPTAAAIETFLASDEHVTRLDTARTVADGLARATADDVDAVVVDVDLPEREGDGIAAVRRLRSIQPRARIIVLTADATFALLVAAADAGADLVVPKGTPPAELAAALVDGGERPIEIDLRDPPGDASPGAGLTPRELDVLRLLVEGHTPKTIAGMLDISVHTTRGHIKNLLWKLGEHSQLGAVAAAARLGLLDRSSGRIG